MARTARTHNSNQMGAVTLADQIDLTAPGGIEALLEAHRRTFGDATMKVEDDEDDEDLDDDLLNDEDGDEDEDDEDEDEDDEDKGDGKGRGRNAKYVTAADVERALDRRINVVLREIRKQGESGNSNGRGRSQRGGKDTDAHTQGPQPSDVRDARASFRDYVSDEIKFLSKEERQHATTLAGSMIRERLATGDDPDEVGQRVARDVASELRKLRSFYSRRTVDKLRQRGRLIDGPEVVQRAPGSKTGPSNSSKMKAGEAMAHSLYADRQKKNDD